MATGLEDYSTVKQSNTTLCYIAVCIVRYCNTVVCQSAVVLRQRNTKLCLSTVLLDVVTLQCCPGGGEQCYLIASPQWGGQQCSSTEVLCYKSVSVLHYWITAMFYRSVVSQECYAIADAYLTPVTGQPMQKDEQVLPV